MSTELTPAQAIRGSIVNMRPEFAKALPRHIPAERFERVVLTAISSTPDLLHADRTSLFAACTKAAQVGLVPDGREAALVTFKTKQKDGSWLMVVQFMPMTAGLMKLVRNSGELLSVSTACVRDTDSFEHWTDDDGEHFKHVPNYDQQGNIRLVYAFAKTKDGGRYLEVMSRDEVEQVRAISRAKDSGPWVSWWAEMARKTVFRRLSKRLPMSTDLDDAMRADDDLNDFSEESPPPRDVGAPSAPVRLSAVRARGQAAEAQAAPAEEPVTGTDATDDDLLI